MTAEQWEKYGSETFTGFDTDETMCRLSCMNLMLHSVINPQLNKQDSVSKDYQVKDAYDLILANPPFKGTLIRRISMNPYWQLQIQQRQSCCLLHCLSDCCV